MESISQHALNYFRLSLTIFLSPVITYGALEANVRAISRYQS